MTVASMADPQLVIVTPGGRLSHPVSPATVCATVRRLAPHMPPAVWSVDPRPNRSKVDPVPSTKEAAWPLPPRS